jgi:MoaA/NifB/PqqE/SkfB family radical SAM enzyme
LIQTPSVARRRRRPAGSGRTRPPERPIGIKLELTHACNLRCDFCYTDSPRHTVARTADLSDDAWRLVVEQALELGIVEAVITGRDQLLRAPLTLELVERLCAEGVGVTLNTNGWFVSAAIADRLARLPGLTVDVSVDGATAELHDAARGVPGSWRRAIEAIALLLDRGVKVVVVHVVTPLNERWVGELLEQLWLLGVGLVRVTPVVTVGAASRERGWKTDRRALERAVAESRRRFGDDFRPTLHGEFVALLPRRTAAPASMLVRPSGAVLIDSLHPFSFGRVGEGLAACWERIVAGWRSPEIDVWARGITRLDQLGSAPTVPYADLERALAGEAVAPVATRGHEPSLPRRDRRSNEPGVAPGDLAAARARVLERGLGRRYVGAPIRWSGDRDGERVVRSIDDGRTWRLNATAGLVLEQVSGRTAGDAAGALAALHPEVPRERIVADTIRTVHWLTTRRLVRAAPAS